LVGHRLPVGVHLVELGERLLLVDAGLVDLLELLRQLLEQVLRPFLSSSAFSSSRSCVVSVSFFSMAAIFGLASATAAAIFSGTGPGPA